MAKYVCSVCGYTVEGEAPEKCPICGAVREVFTKMEDGEKKYTTEHVVGVAKDVDPIILEGLKANFAGECTEVGMYLAMSRQADREGYPEIAEAYKRYAFEEADDVHATPTMLINGEKIVGTKPYYEIKEKLIQHGARKK